MFIIEYKREQCFIFIEPLGSRAGNKINKLVDDQTIFTHRILDMGIYLFFNLNMKILDIVVNKRFGER